MFIMVNSKKTEKKSDDRAFFYDNSKDRVFTGKMVDDKYVNGYLVSYDADGAFKSIIYLEFDSNDSPSKVMKQEELDTATKERVQKEVALFREIVLGEDYFGMIYKKISEVTDFVKNDMTEIGILDDEDGYPKIMKIGAAYNDIKVYTKLKDELN